MKKMSKIFSCVITVIMLVTVLPLGTFAVDSDDSKTSVTVYLTISDDGYFTYGNDENQTIMARVPITVDYFPLSDYGLEKYDRCEADTFENGGEYISDTVVERPTLLHLFIKAAEEYYLGGEKMEVGGDAMSVSGAPTSMYFTKYWGHDYNQTYLVDHSYYLMNATTSATADYILLEDGMEIDVAMFTKSNFFFNGKYAQFEQTEYNVSAGDEVSFSTVESFVNYWAGSAPETPVKFPGLYTTISDENWFEVADLSEQAADNGEFKYTFDKPGKYYVTAIDYNSGDPDSALIAPAVAVVNVEEKVPKKLEGKIYYQINSTKEQVRFIAEINLEDLKSAKSGNITLSINGAEITDDITNVYNSIYANGQKITAEEGKCFVISPNIIGGASGTEISVNLSLDSFDEGLTKTIVIK